jgi:hypothetical protein
VSVLALAGAVVVAVPIAARVSVGDEHACSLGRDGRVLCWDLPPKRPVPVRVTALDGASAISAGGDRTCGIVGARARCVGGRGEPVPDAERAEADAIALSAGRSHACVVRRSGIVSCWGDGALGAVASVSGSTRVSAGPFGTCSVQRSGALVCWGAASLIPWAPAGPGFRPPDPTPPTELRGARDVVDVSLRGAFPCLVRRSGRVSCWTPDDAPTLLPINPLPAGSEVEGLTDAVAISGSLVLRATGTLASVELDFERDPPPFVATPFGAPTLTGVVDADGSSARGCAVLHTGRVVCW